MFCLIPFLMAPTDVAVSAGVGTGVNDNVAETRLANAELVRHGAAFSGAMAMITLKNVGAKSNYVFMGDTRINYVTRFDGVNSSIYGNANGILSGGWTLGKFTSASLLVTGQIGRQSFSRVSENALTRNLDTLVEGSVIGAIDSTLSLYQELSSRFRLQLTAGTTISATFDAPPFPLADGLELDRRGLDGITVRGGTNLFYDFTQRTSGILGVNYRYIAAPYSINSFVLPPKIGGPQRTHQVVADIGVKHLISEHWQTTTRVGVSFANTVSFDPDPRLVVLPVASQELGFMNERFQAMLSASFTYSALVPRVGTGPLLAASATFSGQPFVESWIKKLVMVGAVTLASSSVTVRADQNQTLRILGAGASIEARYPVTKVLGVHLGYDFYFTNSKPGDQDAINSHRNMVFLGVSGYWTTDGNIQPLGTRVIPRQQ